MRLNNFKIKSLPINKKISDGSGLNLTLTSRDNGNWTFRYTYNGKAKEMGLGSYPEISIVEARNLALEKRTLKSSGVDPIFEKKTLKKQEQEKAKRLQNAKTDPTFLLTPVKLMTTFTCYNIKPFELEQKIQNFFNEVRLDIEISYNGKLHKPREWFKVPKLVIEEAIKLLMKDELNNYFYNRNIEEIVLRRET